MPHLAENRQAYHEYEILEKIEAGIVLSGGEVKSAKAGQINLRGSYMTIRDGAAWIINMHIAPYQPKNQPKGYNPTRTRKLLLRKEEIDSLIGKSKAQGQTVIPLSVYSKRGLIKTELALVRGKKSHDKRSSIKKREADREIGRAMRRKA